MAAGPLGRSGRIGSSWKPNGVRTMRVGLAYGDGRLAVELPAGVDLTVVEPTYQAPVADPSAALRAAVRRPVAGPPLRDVVRPGQTVAISMCDGTRAQPRHLMIPVVLEELEGLVRLEDVTVLVATGTHRGNSPAELRAMLGRRRGRRPGGQPRRPRRRPARMARLARRRRPGAAQPDLVGVRCAHHDRLRRAALLRRVQWWAEDGGTGPGRSRDRAGPAQRAPASAAIGPRGASSRGTLSTTASVRWSMPTVAWTSRSTWRSTATRRSWRPSAAPWADAPAAARRSGPCRCSRWTTASTWWSPRTPAIRSTRTCTRP